MNGLNDILRGLAMPSGIVPLRRVDIRDGHDRPSALDPRLRATDEDRLADHAGGGREASIDATTPRMFALMVVVIITVCRTAGRRAPGLSARG